MKYLLDTHAFVWLDGPFEKLSKTVQQAIVDPDNTIYLSLASIWEMQIKQHIGKMVFRDPLPKLIADHQKNNRIQLLPIELPHIFTWGSLPDYHRDPFDRLLIAQTKAEDLTLITDDAYIKMYPIKIFW